MAGEPKKANPFLFNYMAACVEAEAARRNHGETIAAATRESDSALDRIKSARLAIQTSEERTQDARGQMYTYAFGNIITKDVIDVLAPHHDDEDCDEEKPEQHEENCTRCFLLYSLTQKWRLPNVEITVKIRNRRG